MDAVHLLPFFRGCGCTHRTRSNEVPGIAPFLTVQTYSSYLLQHFLKHQFVFPFLFDRILLVHGHWFYVRTATLVQYFFYKNLAGFTAQLIFACFNSFSTQPVYDTINLTMFNILFTSVPIFAYGLILKEF